MKTKVKSILFCLCIVFLCPGLKFSQQKKNITFDNVGKTYFFFPSGKEEVKNSRKKAAEVVEELRVSSKNLKRIDILLYFYSSSKAYLPGTYVIFEKTEDELECFGHPLWGHLNNHISIFIIGEENKNGADKGIKYADQNYKRLKQMRRVLKKKMMKDEFMNSDCNTFRIP